MSIFLTGSSGFVGKNIFRNFSDYYKISNYIRDSEFIINEDIVIHLAGKAHDLKNISHQCDYYFSNTELTKKVFDAFLVSKAKVFITISSVKAVTDKIHGKLTEEVIPNPTTHYGKSKLLADEYILSKKFHQDKRVYILRPCMIHGPGNKGNLNLLFKFVSKSIPWPLGSFDNKRSFCSIDNLMFIIKELVDRDDIPSGIYNVADDDSLSTNELISILAETQNRKAKIWKISQNLIQALAKLGDRLSLPLTTERLQKLTESYEVSNQKIKFAIGKELPVTSKYGLLKTFKSFHSNAK
jgi:nucleoside-diphosphate-sugar epimerase